MKRPKKEDLLASIEKESAKNKRLKNKLNKVSVELKETKELYHSLVDLSPEPIILHNEGIITYANNAAVKLFGFKTTRQFVGKNILDLVPEEHLAIIRERIKRHDNALRLKPLHLKARRNDGAEFFLEALASAITTKKGKSVQVIIRDITRQKLAELELLRVNRALEALSAINQTLIRAESEESFINDACRLICEIGGYTMTWIGYLQNDSEKSVKPVAWKGKEEGYLSLIKVTTDNGPYSKGPAGLSVKTGKTQVVQNLEAEWNNPAWKSAASQRGFKSIIALPIKVDGIVIGTIAIYSANENSFDKEETVLLERLSDDISFGLKTLRAKVEKNKAEQFLRESEDRYRSLIELSPEAVIVHSEGKIMYANNSTLKYLCATSKEELIGQSMSDLVPIEYKNEIHERMRIAKESPNNVEPLQMKLNLKDGSIIYLEAVGAPVKYLGQPAGQVIIHDITARKLYEEELKNSREQLRNLAAHLQNAREAERAHVAREIHDELGQFLTGLKMDISLLKEMVEDLPEAGSRAAIIDKIESASELLNKTVISVRQLSSDLRPAVLDNLGLIPAIEWQTEEFQNRMGINCECFITVDEVLLPPDHITAVFRILQESLTNIARHSEASRVTVELGREENYYRLEINDNGIGISEEDKLKSNSFGLLGIKERVNLFGGSVNISGAKNKGSKISVLIPIQKNTHD